MKFTRQFDQMDCGPACIRMVASAYGKDYPLSYLRSLPHLTREGVSVALVRQPPYSTSCSIVRVRCKFLRKMWPRSKKVLPLRQAGCGSSRVRFSCARRHRLCLWRGFAPVRGTSVFLGNLINT